MEQIWYLPNLIALLTVIAVLIWQSVNNTGYARKQQDDCEDELARVREQLVQERIQRERTELLLMGAGIHISGGRVIVGRDMVGGDVDKRDDTRAGGDIEGK